MKSIHLQFTCNKTALCVKATTILLATLTIYHQDLIIVGNEAIRSELMSHILAIPLLITYLVYRKRKILRAVIPFETSTPIRKTILTREFVGAMLCLLAFLLYWRGSYSFHPLEYHIVSFPLFVAGCTLTIFNTQTLKVLAFPVAFLLFLTPLPLEIVYVVGSTLSTLSSEAAYKVVKATNLPVSLATQYETPIIILQKSGGIPLTFAVDVACAGIYSLTGFTIFAVFAAYIARGTVWKKVTIFLIGFPLIFALNVTRIIIIVLIGNQYGMEAAMQAFHLLGGWVLIFVGTLILLTLSEKIFKIQLFTTKPKTACNYCSQNPAIKQNFCPACGKLLNPINIRLSKRDLSKIFILIVSAILIVNLQVPVFALTQGPTEVTVQTLGGEQNTTQIFPEIQRYATKFIYRDKKFEEIAKQDASLVYAYLPTDETKTPIWITMEIAKTRSSLDPWESCLITYRERKGGKPLATQLDLRDVQLLENLPLIARYFAFQRINSDIIEVVLYWYENAIFNTGSGLQKEYVKLSLIAYGNNPEEIPKIEERLLPFGEAIANHWQPIKTWSQITLTIAQHGTILITITPALLAIALALQVIEKQKERKSNLRVYNKLALEEEKLILQAAHQAAKEDKPTGNEIASCYQRLAGKPIESGLLLQKLNEAEEAGLVKREVMSHNDEPVLVWKNQVPF